MEIRRFFNCLVPIHTCNLKCSYCFLTQRGKKREKLMPFPVRPQKIAKALSQKRVGGICLINLCAEGETLFLEDTVNLTECLLKEGHFVSIVTNTTVDENIRRLCCLESRERIFVKCSFHYLELLRLNLVDRFFDNVTMLRQAGISYTIEMVADDNAKDCYDDIVKLFQNKNEALPHILESRIDPGDGIPRLTKDDLKSHRAEWGKYHSELFDAMQQIWGEKRKEFCYAGDLSVGLDLATGDLTQCIGGRIVQNIYADMESKINFCAIGDNCPLPHCFISYVWQGLCGNIETISFPTYAKMRNRLRLDNTEWLKNPVRGVFAKRSREAIQLYSEEKKNVISACMRVFQFNGLISQDERELIRNKLTQIYNNNVIDVYGAGNLGRMFYKLLQEAGAKVRYIVDRNANYIEYEDERVKCIRPDEYIRYMRDDLENIVVLITPFIDAEKIRVKLQGANKNLRAYTVFDFFERLR